MKIKDVRTTWLSLPLKTPLSDSSHVLNKIEWILVEVLTDANITGISCMLTFDYGPELLKGIIDTELKELVLGQDPLYVENVRKICWDQTEYIGQSGVAAWGIAAIDIALWDLLGKHLNCPVYKLLGARRDQVPIYGSGGWVSYSLDELLQEVSSYVERGFKAVKMKVGSADWRRDIERVKAVRNVIGGDITLMLDANQAWTPHQAVSFSKKVEQFDIFWLEEPISKDDLEGYAQVSARTDIPIATGEREFSLFAFRDLMARNAVAIVQPDVLRIGGLSQAVKLAHTAEAFHCKVAAHFYKEIDIHLMASIDNGLYLEYFPWLDDLLVNPLEISDGLAKAPNRPGLGIEFKPEAIKRYKVD